MDDDKVQVVGYQKSTNSYASKMDVLRRSVAASIKYEEFFTSKEHQAKVAATQTIVCGFFRACKAIYENHRTGRNQPFTVIKVEKPLWPAVSKKVAEEKFYNPLKELGIKPTFVPGTNSWLFRVY